MGQVKFCASAQGDGCAEHASGVFQHEVHFFGCDLLCCDNQVAFILAILIIHHDDKLALSEIVDGFFDGIEFEIFHFPYTLLLYI